MNQSGDLLAQSVRECSCEDSAFWQHKQCWVGNILFKLRAVVSCNPRHIACMQEQAGETRHRVQGPWLIQQQRVR